MLSTGGFNFKLRVAASMKIKQDNKYLNHKVHSICEDQFTLKGQF